MTQSETSFQKGRDLAQYFTIAAAVIAGILWILTDVITDDPSDALQTASGFAVGATMAGGMLMGLLYLVHLVKKK